ncbi:hypothetical protein OUZ56_012642 [Daphnia magna]|uniref:Uncharacterized protein n=1 Tax=Daphnia magna TaxID=35525 RepID=A0ABQ9Z3M3_9CRUS|nr:hypothetical protein OUZ56_012642 [Daphnia magna]
MEEVESTNPMQWCPIVNLFRIPRVQHVEKLVELTAILLSGLTSDELEERMYCKAKLIHHFGEEHPESSCLRLVQQELLSFCVRQCRPGFWLTCYPDEILGGSGIQIALRCMTISQVYGSQHHVNVFFCLRMNECSLHRCVLHAVGFCLLRSLYSCPSGNGFRSFFWKLYVCPKNIYHRHIGRQPVESNYFYIYVEFLTGDNNIGEDFRLALPASFLAFRLQYPFVSETMHSLKYRKSNQPVQGSVEDSELMVTDE